jgi:hypothetical protein
MLWGAIHIQPIVGLVTSGLPYGELSAGIYIFRDVCILWTIYILWSETGLVPDLFRIGDGLTLE